MLHQHTGSHTKRNHTLLHAEFEPPMFKISQWSHCINCNFCGSIYKCCPPFTLAWILWCLLKFFAYFPNLQSVPVVYIAFLIPIPQEMKITVHCPAENTSDYVSNNFSKKGSKMYKLITKIWLSVIFVLWKLWAESSQEIIQVFWETSEIKICIAVQELTEGESEWKSQNLLCPC
jgi:hypothetical protein